MTEPMAKETQKKRNSRTTVIDGELMDAYRKQKGWDDLTLSTHANISTKTIERARGGKPIQTESLAMIAEALGVLPVKLLPAADERIRPDPSAPKKPRRLAIIVVDDDSILEEYMAKGSVEQLFLTLVARGLLKDGITNQPPVDGSKIILIEMTDDDYKRMMRAFSSNDLLFHDIVYFGAISDEEPLDKQIAKIKEFSSQRIAELHEARNKVKTRSGDEVTVQIGEDGKLIFGDSATDKLIKKFMDDEKKKKNPGDTKSG